jgi:RNA polymerase sigma-70 factor, ECF subfamily
VDGAMDDRAYELERLYREEGPAVWAYLRCRLADEHAAEEVFQETFLAVASKPGGLVAATSPRAWLIAIARNLLREHHRSAVRHAASPLEEATASPATPVEDDRLDDMRRAIARLPDGQREALELRLGQDLSYAEIAEVLAIPVGTVRSRLHLAVASLRQWATTTDPAGAVRT